jgi:hypothetical protein
MNEQKQNRTKEAAEGATGFAVPDCCGPLMDRMMRSDNEEHVSNGRSICAEMMNKMSEGENPMESCPMSAMFKKTSGIRGFGLLAMIPGLMLVLCGVAIILEPQILVWLMAATAIVAGLMFLAAAHFFRKLAADLRTSVG